MLLRRKQSSALNAGVPLMLLSCPVMFTRVLGFPVRDLLSWVFAEYLLIFVASGVVGGALYGWVMWVIFARLRR